jgi:hypothetical protein
MSETPEESPPAFPFAVPAHLVEMWRRARRGTWRVAVAEESMAPALDPGDWLFLDPTCSRWPCRGYEVDWQGLSPRPRPKAGQIGLRRPGWGSVPARLALAGIGIWG